MAKLLSVRGTGFSHLSSYATGVFRCLWYFVDTVELSLVHDLLSWNTRLAYWRLHINALLSRSPIRTGRLFPWKFLWTGHV